MRLTRPVDFQIFIDGKPTYTGATTTDNKMHWFEAKVGGAGRLAGVRPDRLDARVKRAQRALGRLDGHGPGDVVAKGHDAGAGQRRQIDDAGRASFDRDIQHVGQHEPSFRVGDGHGDRDHFDAGLESLPGRLRQHPARTGEHAERQQRLTPSQHDAEAEERDMWWPKSLE